MFGLWAKRDASRRSEVEDAGRRVAKTSRSWLAATVFKIRSKLST